MDIQPRGIWYKACVSQTWVWIEENRFMCKYFLYFKHLLSLTSGETKCDHHPMFHSPKSNQGEHLRCMAWHHGRMAGVEGRYDQTSSWWGSLIIQKHNMVPPWECYQGGKWLVRLLGYHGTPHLSTYYQWVRDPPNRLWPLRFGRGWVWKQFETFFFHCPSCFVLLQRCESGN